MSSMTATPHTASPADVLAAEDVNAWVHRQNIALSAAPQLAAAPGAAVECLREFVALNGRRPVATARPLRRCPASGMLSLAPR